MKVLPKTITNAVISVVNDGGNVAILARNTMQAIEQLTENNPNVAKIRRSNGNEAISMSNGAQIVIRRHSHHLRGYSASLLIIPIGLTHDQRNDVIPCVATTNGEILGYY